MRGGRVSGLLLAMVVAAASPALGQDQAGIAVGDQLAGLVVHDLDGADRDLGAVFGRRPVLIEFWATWCTSCAAMLPKLKAAHETFGDAVDFIGINVTVGDSKQRVRDYIRREHPPFEVLYDDAGTAASAWDPPATSFIVIADRSGRVIYTGLGGNQNVTAALQQASGRQHQQEGTE